MSAERDAGCTGRSPGPWAGAAPRARTLVRGLAGADSMDARDAHKWLNVPYDRASRSFATTATLQRRRLVVTARYQPRA